jgi:hypothetical protein
LASFFIVPTFASKQSSSPCVKTQYGAVQHPATHFPLPSNSIVRPLTVADRHRDRRGSRASLQGERPGSRAVLLSALALGETVDPPLVAGAALIAAGIRLVVPRAKASR